AVCFSYVLGALVSFETNHGVLAGVVATLLFFYLSAVTIFFGAQVNIAIATIGPDGAPQWPHPHLVRPEGFDESQVEAYRVLTTTRPKEGAFSRFWHHMCGGAVCDG
ncbi:MAG: YihY/virulence factor BrkB family protein, partial [Rhodobacteraceae bacterium]|nr:YihY/virulence factor BrkB family protein [Paracoccaceae bacterium]